MRPNEGRPGKAQKALNGNVENPLLSYEFDRGSNYETDTGLTRALSALVPDEELHHPDHRFFQLSHLMTEYAWVAIHDCLAKAHDSIASGQPLRARRAIERAVGAAEIPLNCVRGLQDSLPQLSLLAMRSAFPPNTSGLDSPGMRNLRRVSRAVWAEFTARLSEQTGLTPAELLGFAAPPDGPNRLLASDTQAPKQAFEQADVLTALYRLDNRILEWKRAHVNLVWMTVGGGPGLETAPAGNGPVSIRGSSVSELERMAAKPLFAELWQLTTDAFRNLATGSGPYARTDLPPQL